MFINNVRIYVYIYYLKTVPDREVTAAITLMMVYTQSLTG
jgi:hypothetical protein